MQVQIFIFEMRKHNWYKWGRKCWGKLNLKSMFLFGFLFFLGSELWSVPFACSECDSKLFELPATFWVVANDSESAMSHATVSSTVKFYFLKKNFLTQREAELNRKIGNRQLSPKAFFFFFFKAIQIAESARFSFSFSVFVLCYSFQHRTVLCLERHFWYRLRLSKTERGDTTHFSGICAPGNTGLETIPC